MLSSSPCSSTDHSFFSGSKPFKSNTSSTSSVTVSTRISRRPVQPQGIASSSLTSLPLASSLSSHSSSPPPTSKKRKSHSNDSYAESSDVHPAVKRLRTTQSNPRASKRQSSSKPSSRASSRKSSPEPIYRSDRSRSTSVYPCTEVPTLQPSRRWASDQDDFTGSNHLTSARVVQRLLKFYKTFFRNPDDADDKTYEAHELLSPSVELEYPNTNASERFLLLAPKDKDHYNPIMDLESTLYTIVDCYLTQEQQALFGPLPSINLSESVTPPSSPSPSPPSSTASTSSTRSSTSSSLSSLSTSTLLNADRLPILRAVQRAIHLQHGPLFINAMKRVNAILRDIKQSKVSEICSSPGRNPLMSRIEMWTGSSNDEKILMRIIEENYQRTVGPNVRSLKRYEAFSSTVYGELMPPLVYEIVQMTGLNENSLFLDLGSGVGNVVIQASLQSGCTSYGIELMPHPAKVAKDMVEQIKIRCQMWGVRIGEIELEEGDMLTSSRLDELIPKADVVLVDNKVFEESLNEAIRPKFLDLKEGAYVVSLKPFVNAVNARVTKRNVDDMSAIFDVQEKTYHPGGVSWGSSGGSYFVHQVDREGYAKIKHRFESLHGTTTRSTRSRR